ncbi:hypothetical protein M885DRAFT_536405, partial [Pelagophyceae sp. CCMP2097]
MEAFGARARRARTRQVPTGAREAVPPPSCQPAPVIVLPGAPQPRREVAGRRGSIMEAF